MFGRQVTVKLKANSATELTRIAENEIIPILRKQKGFRGETTLIAPERQEAIVNSFWDTKEDAEAYGRAAYPEVLKTLSNVIEGTPTIKNFEFANSTFHQAAAARTAGSNLL
jgi:heme-degrading monooxygenase HmoA